MNAVLALVVAAALMGGSASPPPRAFGEHVAAPAEETVGEVPFAGPPTAAEVRALPEARYDAVIPALDAPVPKRFGRGPSLTYTLTADVPLYGADRGRPVARLAARNFLGDPTVIAAYPARRDGWQLVLTPARWRLPSSGNGATAQSYGWVRSDDLPDGEPVVAVIEISLKRQTLTVTGPGGRTVFPAGVGGDSTPTPSGVTGYLQARYLDPGQAQAVHPIQLTSLHATAADEPYGGSDGGLIGIHLGAGDSHGCVRIGRDAVAAVNALPLGTPVLID